MPAAGAQAEMLKADEGVSSPVRPAAGFFVSLVSAHMLRARLLVVAFITATLIRAPEGSVVAGAERPRSGKKVVEWGWDEPDTKFIDRNIGRMEQLPFDGLVFHVNGSKGESLVWQAWGKHRFALEDFKQG